MILLSFYINYLRKLQKQKKSCWKKHASREVLSFFKKHSIFKEKSGESKIKRSTENLTSMIYEIFILELYIGTFYFGISIVLLLRR